MKRHAKVFSFVVLAATSIAMCGCTSDELMQVVSFVLPMFL